MYENDLQEDREYEEMRRYNNMLANQQAEKEAKIRQRLIEKKKDEIVLAFQEVKQRQNHSNIEINKLFQLKNLHTQNTSTSQIIKRNIALLRRDKEQQTATMNALERELNKIGYRFKT